MITNDHQWKRHTPCARPSSASWPPPRSPPRSPSPPHGQRARSPTTTTVTPVAGQPATTKTVYKYSPVKTSDGPTQWATENAPAGTHTTFVVKGKTVDYFRDGTKTSTVTGPGHRGHHRRRQVQRPDGHPGQPARRVRHRAHRVLGGHLLGDAGRGDGHQRHQHRPGVPDPVPRRAGRRPRLGPGHPLHRRPARTTSSRRTPAAPW